MFETPPASQPTSCPRLKHSTSIVPEVVDPVGMSWTLVVLSAASAVHCTAPAVCGLKHEQIKVNMVFNNSISSLNT